MAITGVLTRYITLKGHIAGSGVQEKSMTDIHDQLRQENARMRNRVCRVSYVLNNAQPVRSTIIGNQPLFYMDDFSCGVDDDEGLFFDPSEITVLENEIESLRKEIQGFERLTQEYAQEPDRHYQYFLDDKKTISNHEQPQMVFTTVDELIAVVNRSRLAKEYFGCAEEHKVKCAYSHQIETATYERKTGLILINPSLGVADQILLTARELRRHWQHRQGALVNPLLFHPDNAILINRMQTADLMVAMVRIAWELQLSGTREAWERIENSSFADLGRAFAREAFVDFRTVNNGQAGAAVLESWFLSERCRQEDKKLIKQMLADYRGYVFDREEGHNTLTPALISALGAMPYGKNYLAAHVQTLLTDPVFNEVRDRSNANFLWFIKFERSFRETERDLQKTGKNPLEMDVRPAQNPAKTKAHPAPEENYDKEKNNIVTLYAPEATEPATAGDKTGAKGRILPPKPGTKRKKTKGISKTGASNVVYLRRWSGE